METVIWIALMTVLIAIGIGIRKRKKPISPSTS